MLAMVLGPALFFMLIISWMLLSYDLGSSLSISKTAYSIPFLGYSSKSDVLVIMIDTRDPRLFDPFDNSTDENYIYKNYHVYSSTYNRLYAKKHGYDFKYLKIMNWEGNHYRRACYYMPSIIV